MYLNILRSAQQKDLNFLPFNFAFTIDIDKHWMEHSPLRKADMI